MLFSPCDPLTSGPVSIVGLPCKMLYNISANKLFKKPLRKIEGQKCGRNGFGLVLFVPHSWVSGLTQQAIAQLIGGTEVPTV